MTQETKDKISVSKKGKSTWSKGRHLSVAHRKNLSNAIKRMSNTISPEQQTKMIAGRIGKPLSLSHRRILSIGKSGAKNPMWKGGVNPVNNNIRKSLDYRLWRTAVFERDSYTCVLCFVKGGVIQADHIKRFSEYPELRFDLNNGRTLCVPCHKNTDTFGGKKI